MNCPISKPVEFDGIRSGLWEQIRNPGFARAHQATAPAWNGVPTSSSPFQSLSQGDEDIASPKPFPKGAVSECARFEPRGFGTFDREDRSGDDHGFHGWTRLGRIAQARSTTDFAGVRRSKARSLPIRVIRAIRGSSYFLQVKRLNGLNRFPRTPQKWPEATPTTDGKPRISRRTRI